MHGGLEVGERTHEQKVWGSNPTRGSSFTNFLEFFLSFWPFSAILVLLFGVVFLKGIWKNGQNWSICRYVHLWNFGMKIQIDGLRSNLEYLARKFKITLNWALCYEFVSMWWSVPKSARNFVILFLFRSLRRLDFRTNWNHKLHPWAYWHFVQTKFYYALWFQTIVFSPVWLILS